MLKKFYTPEDSNEELYNAGYFIDFNTKRIFHLTRPLN